MTSASSRMVTGLLIGRWRWPTSPLRICSSVISGMSVVLIWSSRIASKRLICFRRSDLVSLFIEFPFVRCCFSARDNADRFTIIFLFFYLFFFTFFSISFLFFFPSPPIHFLLLPFSIHPCSPYPPFHSP